MTDTLPQPPEAYIQEIAENLTVVIRWTRPGADEMRELIASKLRKFWRETRQLEQMKEDIKKVQ